MEYIGYDTSAYVSQHFRILISILASALSFLYFKELMQRYTEFFNYPNISLLFFGKISNQIQEPHQKSF